MGAQSVITISSEQLREVIRETIRDELTACGILMTTSADKLEAQADARFLRQWRKNFDAVVTKVGSAVILAIVGGVIALVTLGFNVKFGK